MKYIRTENAVYEKDKVVICVDAFSEKEWVEIQIDVNTSQLLLIIKESDTIEELFDELVVKHKSNKKPYVADGYQKHQILEDRQKVFEYGVEEVKGAIYTSEGLIYVGKMNKNGGFDLIWVD